ncbi:CG12974 [Drosophila busckii]|uniref:CG12974 n=1 Tax=Drosophila busckii TaxID=30019 RepID=A0A0M5J5Z8_DROBS|nr:uncharacterized protein LOC108598687 [Drosophila busckii]ALC44194.1 CG12974 [Drosophila busckii]
MYGTPKVAIKHFDSLKLWTNWAGALGMVQACIWIGLTITAILAYNCELYISDYMTWGSYLKLVFFDVYFRGNCQMSTSDYQNYNTGTLYTVQTVFTQEDILIWSSVYLGVSVCWLIVSIVLLACVRKDNVKLTLGAIYAWVCFMAIVCAMDVAAGVIFGIDYDRFHAKALTMNANSINVGEINPNGAQLLAAGVAALSMMIISLKGFVLWLMNFGLLVYLLARALQIVLDKKDTETLFMPRKDSDDILTTRAPIRAYEDETIKVQAYSNEAYIPETRSTAETIEVNEEAIVRAAHMSQDASLMDRRFRNIDAFQQYPAPNSSRTPRQQSQGPVQETVIVATAGFPVPDYSPQPSPNPNGILRHPHY